MPDKHFFLIFFPNIFSKSNADRRKIKMSGYPYCGNEIAWIKGNLEIVGQVSEAGSVIQ